MITCIRFWVGLVVPYKVTMVIHTHFEECTKFGTFSTKMCSVSGVAFGWHEAAPCAPAVRSCSRSYQPNAPLEPRYLMSKEKYIIWMEKNTVFSEISTDLLFTLPV